MDIYPEQENPSLETPRTVGRGFSVPFIQEQFHLLIVVLLSGGPQHGKQLEVFILQSLEVLGTSGERVEPSPYLYTDFPCHTAQFPHLPCPC